MAIITELKPKGKKQKYYTVYLNGKVCCVLGFETLIRANLRVGQEIMPSYLYDLQFENEKLQALDKAVKLISRSIKTEKQIRTYLYDKGYFKKIVDFVLIKLKEYKYVDDQYYASAYVNLNTKSKGKRMLKYELKLKGVTEEIIKNELEKVESEFENALNLARKYISNKEKNDKLKLKLYRYLLGRGFEYEDVKAAINICLGGKSDEVWD